MPQALRVIDHFSELSGQATPAQLSPAVLGHLRVFDWPRIGTSKTNFIEGTAPHQMSPEYPILYLGAGNSGVVRSIFFTAPMANFDTHVYRMRVWTGAGNLQDFTDPPSQCLRMDVPLKSLWFTWFHNRQTDVYPTEWLWVAPLAESGLLAPIPGVFQFLLPIPFTNGILIQVGEINDEDDWVPLETASAFTWTGYELGSLPNWTYQNYRLKAAFVEAITNDQNPTVTFLNEPSGGGVLAGMLLSQQGQQADQAPEWLENNLKFKFDGESSPEWQVSGTEDFFGSNGYWFRWGLVQLPRWGLCRQTLYAPNIKPAYEMYRWFDRDPVFWTNGAIGQFSVPAYHHDVIHKFLTFYYQEQP